MSTEYSDYIVSATAGNAQIRAFACTTRGLVEHARQIHNTSPVMTAALGRLLTAGAMMGSTMKGDKDLLTLQIRGDGPGGGVTVTAESDGFVRGCVVNPNVLIPAKPNGKLDVSGALGNGSLSVIRDLGLKEPYVGQIQMISGEIAEDITYYYVVSEQVPSSVGLGVLMNRDNTVRQAGGFIVQLLPFAQDEIIDKLEANLQSIPSVTTILDQGHTPEELLEIVLAGLDVEFTGKQPCGYRCNCSRERIEQVLLSLGKKDLEELAEDENGTEINCQFCNTNYRFSPEEIKILIANGTGEGGR